VLAKDRLRRVPSEAAVVRLEQFQQNAIVNVSSLKGKWQLQVPRLAGQGTWRTSGVAGMLLDLYTSDAAKLLDMELVSPPVVSISADGRVLTRVQLRWGPSKDTVTLEGRLAVVGKDQLEQTPMTAQSATLKLSGPPVQPARRLRVAFADDELLVLRDAASSAGTEVLWRVGGGGPKPLADAQALTQQELESLAQDAALRALDAKFEKLEGLAQAEKWLEKFEERSNAKLQELHARWEVLESQEATSRRRIQEAVSDALGMTHAKLEELSGLDPLAGKEEQLKDLEDRASAKLRELDIRWEGLIDHEAASRLRMKEAVATALSVLNTKLDELNNMDPFAGMEEQLKDLEDSAHMRVEAVRAKAEERLEEAARAAVAECERRIDERLQAASARMEKQLDQVFQTLSTRFEDLEARGSALDVNLQEEIRAHLRDARAQVRDARAEVRESRKQLQRGFWRWLR